MASLDDSNNEVATNCVICGSHIIAGTYPPVCCGYCLFEYKIECEFNIWAKDQIKKKKMEKGEENGKGATQL